MKTIFAGLALATISALGLASKADAAPMSPVATSVAFHGRSSGGWRGGVGIGISTGGGYGYGGGHQVYVPPTGYYATQYRTVPTTVFAGYDAYHRPVYTTQYVQQAYQVWVQTGGGYYTSSYGGYGYAPRTTIGFGAGYRWR